MKAELASFISGTAQGTTAEAVLRACVHCGFCNSACPTYRLLGDELDGPRGRIYQIKNLLEGGPAAASIHTHLDRCLTCRACEPSCPSGVEYGRLLDIGREVAEQRIARPRVERLKRRLLRAILPWPRRFAPLLRIGRALRPVLPSALRRLVPLEQGVAGAWPVERHVRRVAILGGCVQPALAPSIDAAAARVFDRLGISLVQAPATGCCGALSHHLAASEEARAIARRNIDAWCTLFDQGVEAILGTASGCGVHLRSYADLLAHDPAYSDKARRVVRHVRDPVELVDAATLAALPRRMQAAPRVAVHTPCTLQHGQGLGGRVEELLRAVGCELATVADATLCCGSAGSYSLLQPALAEQLGANKAAALQQGAPALIVSANIGCQLHIGARARVPVRHWLELLDDILE